MDSYLEKTKENDRKAIFNFENYYSDILFNKRDGNYTDGEEYLINEYISAKDREDRRKTNK